jgi:hypothetical protein
MVEGSKAVADIIKKEYSILGLRSSVLAKIPNIPNRSSQIRPISGKQLAVGAALVTSALLLKGASGRLLPQALKRVPVY